MMDGKEIWEWMSEPETSRILANGVVYGFSLLGLFLTPSILGRWAWFFPGWFAVLGFFLLLLPEAVHPRKNFVIYLAMSQGPWIIFCLDLVRGRLRSLLVAISMRSLLAWSAFRFLALHNVFMFGSGVLPPMIAIPNAAGEVMTAIGGMGLWALYRPDRRWFRLLLLLWNAYGLTAVLSASVRRILANPESPWQAFPSDGHRYLSGLPQAWDGFFWAPIAVAIHVAVFYKMYAERKIPEMERS